MALSADPPPAASQKRRRLRLDLGTQFQLKCPCCYRPGVPFCDDHEAKSSAEKLVGLRSLMKAAGADAYIVTSQDAHSSEYVAPADERRCFLTGFSGSAGTALITEKEALLWTDSRYFLQAEKQLAGTEWVLMRQFSAGVPDLHEWVLENLRGKCVAVDPALVPAEVSEEWRAKWGSSVTLKAISENLIDAIWSGRPDDPCNLLHVHPLEYAGETVQSKLQRVRDAIKAEGAEVLLLSALDQIAWLFNLRGSDIACNPVFFSYAAVSSDAAVLFLRGVDEGRAGLSKDVQDHLQESGVTARPYSRFFSEVLPLLDGKKVFLEPSSCSMALVALVEQGLQVLGNSPVEKFKAAKNAAEIEGLRRACKRDSLALCELLASLEERLCGPDAGLQSPLTETQAAELMGQLRRKQELIVGDSFETISSSGSNSAIVHYRAQPGACKTLHRDQIYLIDTGGQYKDGTTDVTRTVHFGDTTSDQRRLYTRVLQGHIALARAVFPAGTPGIMLDAYARQPLWQDGLQYGHGTGHGIGAYLNVHEGPHGIGGGTVPGGKIQGNSRMKRVYLSPLEAGNCVSNEPGCYKDGDFGIRIESDLVAVPADTVYCMGGRSFLRFENLTLVPMCRNLVEPTLLERTEEQWLDAYHSHTWNTLKTSLPEGSMVRDWLWKATRPIRM